MTADDPDVACLVAVLARRDVTGLRQVLHPDVVLVSDGGGRVVTPLRPVGGSDAVAARLVALVTANAVVTVEGVNGRPSVVVRVDGLARAVIALAFARSVVTRVWLVLNPDKLGRWHRAMPSG